MLREVAIEEDALGGEPAAGEVGCVEEGGAGREGERGAGESEVGQRHRAGLRADWGIRQLNF